MLLGTCKRKFSKLVFFIINIGFTMIGIHVCKVYILGGQSSKNYFKNYLKLT